MGGSSRVLLVTPDRYFLELNAGLMHAQDWIQLARYGHLPVGNLGGDWLLDIADAHFARCLRDCGHLLWITDPSIPDVASRGDDDAMEDLLLSADPAPLEVRLLISFASRAW